MLDGIYKVLRADYDHEIPYVPMSKAFDREVRKFITRQIKPYGYGLVKKKGSPYCESSGFATDGQGHYVYYNVPDFRYWDWENNVLIRTAENEKDYRGGVNHNTSLKDIGKVIDNLMHKSI